MDTNKILGHIQANDTASALVAMVEELPEELSALLEEAHSRYMHLIGITSGEYTEEQIALDRKNFNSLYQRSIGERSAIFDDEDCIKFMVKQYDLPSLLCKIYLANDFNWIAASGFTPDADGDIDESCADFSSYLKDDDLVTDMAIFLFEREALLASPLVREPN